MKALIIEDEKLAAERLLMLLNQYDSSIDILKVLDSVEETVAWLRQGHKLPDLIFLDINLADGSAFEIFQQAQVGVPVIFTTAYDQYALDAFKVLSIDYLLKPISIQALSTAIEKLRRLQRGSYDEHQVDFKAMSKLFHPGSYAYKSRFVGKIGQKLFFIESPRVAFFQADNKIVYLTTLDNVRYLIDYTLEQLETLLDPKFFFRVNRSLIVQISAIEQVKPYLNSRLKLFFKNNLESEETVISRERVAEFRKWADN